MQDILYNAAAEFYKLKDVKYRVKLGRKRNTYDFILHFPPESFFHLAGLQHLTDIVFPSTNKERIFKEILEHNITIEYLKKSIYYESEKVEERITNLYLLEKILEDNKVAYKINPKELVKYSSIVADYLMEYKDSDTYYLFIVKERYNPQFDGEHKGRSFFKKDRVDYTTGTSKCTLLLMHKIYNFGTEQQNEIEIFRNPSYKPEFDEQ